MTRAPIGPLGCGISADEISAEHDAPPNRWPEDQAMPTTYAVIWREREVSYAGVLELGGHGFTLEGTSRTEPRTVHELRCRRVVRIQVGRSPADRIDGRPAVIVELHDGRKLSIASAAGVGFGQEIADRLRQLVQGAGPP